MYKAAVIGDRQSILGFRALGLTAVEAETPEQAARALHRLAADEYAVIFIIEQLIERISKDIDRYNDVPDVAVIPIPSITGSTGAGMNEMSKAVERAAGISLSNIMR